MLKRKAMCNIQRRFGFTSGTAVCQQYLLIGQSFSPDKQLVEGGVLAIRVVRRHGKFYITGQVEVPNVRGAIDKRYPAHLQIVFRRDYQLCFRMDIVIEAAKYRPVK